MTFHAKKLVWTLRERGGKEGPELFASVPLLEHTVGDAGFTIRKNEFDGSHGLIWWHGNRGHHIGEAPTINLAKDMAQEHFNNLVLSWVEG